MRVGNNCDWIVQIKRERGEVWVWEIAIVLEVNYGDATFACGSPLPIVGFMTV
jgi:hypothetical protein